MTWCRRPNGFSDYPKWRAVSARSGLDLCTVLAFVNRLEELGNDAVNRGEIRGSIAGFAVEDFAAALSISSENAKKLLETLEHPDIGWIADGMIADFYNRHPETEDPTATERQRRKRSRERILRKLADLARVGLISSGERSDIEKQLPRLDQAELVDLQLRLDEKSLQLSVTRDSRLSRRDSVTPSANPITIPPSVATDANNVTRDNVTVTPDQNRDYRQAQSATTLTGASVEPVGSAVEEKKVLAVPEPDLSTWLKQEGPKLIMDRMGVPYERAMARLSDWSAQVNDSAVLAGILQGAENRTSHGFHMEVTDQIRRLAH
jgi:hypothetical protein